MGAIGFTPSYCLWGTTSAHSSSSLYGGGGIENGVKFMLNLCYIPKGNSLLYDVQSKVRKLSDYRHINLVIFKLQQAHCQQYNPTRKKLATIQVKKSKQLSHLHLCIKVSSRLRRRFPTLAPTTCLSTTSPSWASSPDYMATISFLHALGRPKLTWGHELQPAQELQPAPVRHETRAIGQQRGELGRRRSRFSWDVLHSGLRQWQKTSDGDRGGVNKRNH
jgi:hypothetical protein